MKRRVFSRTLNLITLSRFRSSWLQNRPFDTCRSSDSPHSRTFSYICNFLQMAMFCTELRSVSYTHLDVYKRQVLDMSRVQRRSPAVCGPSQRIAICCKVDLKRRLGVKKHRLTSSIPRRSGSFSVDTLCRLKRSRYFTLSEILST